MMGVGFDKRIAKSVAATESGESRDGDITSKPPVTDGGAALIFPALAGHPAAVVQKEADLDPSLGDGDIEQRNYVGVTHC